MKMRFLKKDSYGSFTDLFVEMVVIDISKYQQMKEF